MLPSFSALEIRHDRKHAVADALLRPDLCSVLWLFCFVDQGRWNGNRLLLLLDAGLAYFAISLRVVMNYRQELYFTLVNLRGYSLGSYYRRYLQEYRDGIALDTSRQLLVKLFQHCENAVPYYMSIIERKGRGYLDDPFDYLKEFPILTRDQLHCHFNELKSNDLAQRNWFTNSTGGSTGEAAQFIQDEQHLSQMGAVSLLYSKLLGKEIGESEFKVVGLRPRHRPSS